MDMRDLVIQRLLEIQEEAGTLDSQNAMLYLLGEKPLPNWDTDFVRDCVHFSTNEQLLMLYDLMYTKPCDLEIMYGITPEMLRVTDEEEA